MEGTSPAHRGREEGRGRRGRRGGVPAERVPHHGAALLIYIYICFIYLHTHIHIYMYMYICIIMMIMIIMIIMLVLIGAAPGREGEDEEDQDGGPVGVRGLAESAAGRARVAGGIRREVAEGQLPDVHRDQRAQVGARGLEGRELMGQALSSVTPLADHDRENLEQLALC